MDTIDTSILSSFQEKQSIKNRLLGTTAKFDDVLKEIGGNLPEEAITDELINYLLELERTGQLDKLDRIKKFSNLCKLANSFSDFLSTIMYGDLSPRTNPKVRILYEIKSKLLNRIPKFAKTSKVRINPIASPDGYLRSIPFDFQRWDKLNDIHSLAINPKLFPLEYHSMNEKTIDFKNVDTEIVLIDTSSSMRYADSLEYAQLYLLNRLEKALSGQLQFQVITFNTIATHVNFAGSFVIDSYIDAELFKNWIWNLIPMSTTILQNAINKAFELKFDNAVKPPSITIITDDGGMCDIPLNKHNEVNAIATMDNKNIKRCVMQRRGLYIKIHEIINIVEQ